MLMLSLAKINRIFLVRKPINLILEKVLPVRVRQIEYIKLLQV